MGRERSHNELSTGLREAFGELVSSPPRAAAIVAGAYLDAALEHILDSVSESTQGLERGTISSASFGRRIELAQSYLPLGPDFIEDLNIVCKIRNRAAHWFEPFSFSDKPVKGWCGSLNAWRSGDPPPSDPRTRFERTVQFLSFRILLLPIDIAQRAAPGQAETPA